MPKKNTRACTKSIIKGFALCLCLLLLLTGCGGQDSEVQTSPSPTSTDKLGGTGAPLSGGTMKIVMTANPQTLNPLLAKSREMIDLFALMYDPLIRYDDTLSPLPGLAERWELGEDGKTWTLYLCKDAKFHNGQAFTSADVVYTLDQLKVIYADSTLTSTYSGAMKLIASYAAVDDHTLTITCKQKPGHLLSVLTFPIVQNGTISDTTLAGGTGAYVPSNYDATKGMMLTANRAWWRRTPYITNIEVKAMPDPTTALTSMNVKLVDIVHTDALNANTYKQPDSVNVHELMTQEYECIIPNFQRAPMDDSRMRQAILAALDRKTIITEAYLTHAISVDVPIPPDAYYYDQTHVQHAYNPGTAQSLLTEMGYTDTDGDGFVEKDGTPFTLRIIVNENPSNTARVDAAKMARDQLKKVGLQCEVSILSWSNYQKELQAGNFDLALCGFSIPLDGDLSFMLSSTSSQNYGGYASATMDQYLATYTAATTESQIKSTAADIQRLFSQDLPLISLYFRTNTLVTSASVKGIQGARDMGVYRAIEQWYILQEGDEDKVAVPK